MSGERVLTHLSLFSGIGGLDLPAEMAGIETVGQCEWADYPRAVLEKHWPGLPRWRDIRTLTKESFYEQTGLRTVDVISGGFPCQPFSYAGKRRGKDDDRYLWPEFIRVIRELQPAWVIGENVPGIINLALDTVLADLEAEGYEVQCFVVPACGVNAPHRRDRVCIVAYNDNYHARENKIRTGWEAAEHGLLRKVWDSVDGTGVCRVADGIRTAVYKTDPDTESIRQQGRRIREILEFTECSSREREADRVPGTASRTYRTHSAWETWPDEPSVGRVADGVPDRVDRLRCLGNAVVPQQFFPFFDAIARIERMTDNGET